MWGFLPASENFDVLTAAAEALLHSKGVDDDHHTKQQDEGTTAAAAAVAAAAAGGGRGGDRKNGK